MHIYVFYQAASGIYLASHPGVRGEGTNALGTRLESVVLRYMAYVHLVYVGLTLVRPNQVTIVC